MAIHSQFTGLELHELYQYIQESDPGAVGSGLYWLQLSTGLVKRRSTDNSSWLIISPGAFVDPSTTKGDLITRTTTDLARLPIGLDTYVLTVDATQSTGIKWAPPGGSGSVPDWVTNSPDTPPSSPGSLDDEFTGSSLNVKWTWVNQGSATVTVSNGYGNFLVNSTGGTSIRMIVQAVPTAPWTIVCKYSTTLQPSSATAGTSNSNFAYQFGGLILRESSSGKLVTTGSIFDSYLRTYAQHYTNTTTFSSTYGYFDAIRQAQWYWVKIYNDGTHYNSAFSYDGINYYFFAQETIGSYITADQVGILMDAVSGKSMSLVVDYFRQT